MSGWGVIPSIRVADMSGALDFYEKAKKHGVKPIFGCETYVSPDRLDKTERRSNHLHLPVLHAHHIVVVVDPVDNKTVLCHRLAVSVEAGLAIAAAR